MIKKKKLSYEEGLISRVVGGMVFFGGAVCSLLLILNFNGLG
jgi:hypothetical protein